LENVYIFYGHLEYNTAIWDVLCPFGTFYAHLVHFSGFGILCQEKSGNPGAKDTKVIKHIKNFFI
jgi:hypothetical protein